MLRKIIEGIKQLSRTPAAVAPSRFGDPVAEATSWSPAKSGGASFCTHKLVEKTPYRMEFRGALGARLFLMFFFLAGIGMLIVFFRELSLKEKITFDIDLMLLLLAGLVFANAGGWLYYFLTKPRVFDKVIGRYYKGRKSPDLMVQQFEADAKNRAVPLDEIHALQLIAEYCRGQKSSYYSYELNLVLEDGERVNVVDHGNLNKIREDAKSLSNFLGKPVWDGT